MAAALDSRLVGIASQPDIVGCHGFAVHGFAVCHDVAGGYHRSE